eukprot:UN05833
MLLNFLQCDKKDITKIKQNVLGVFLRVIGSKNHREKLLRNMKEKLQQLFSTHRKTKSNGDKWSWASNAKSLCDKAKDKVLLER